MAKSDFENLLLGANAKRISKINRFGVNQVNRVRATDY